MAVLNLMDRMRMEAGFPPLKRQNKDGGPGSGNHGHAGVPGQVGGSAPGKKCASSIPSKTSAIDAGKRKSMTEKAAALRKESAEIADFQAHINSKVKGYDPQPFIDSEKRQHAIKDEARELLQELPAGTLFTRGCTLYEKKDDGKWRVNDGTREWQVSGDTAASEFCGYGDDTDYPPIEFIEKTDDAKMVQQVMPQSSETYSKWAADLNNKDRKDLVKQAKKDPAFKELVDAAVLYTEGGYVEQRQLCEQLVRDGLSEASAKTVGEYANGNLYSFRDLYKGQDLKRSESSMAAGMVHLTEAVNASDPYDAPLFRVTQDRSIIKSDSDRVYVPPKEGDRIKIDAPTSFTASKDVEAELSKGKMGDIIHYELDKGATALNVAQLSRYKQEEYLTCGEFEVVSVQSKTRRAPLYHEPTKAEQLRGVEEDEWGKYTFYYETTVKIRQVGKTEFAKHEDAEHTYAICEGHFEDRMVPEVHEDEINEDGGNIRDRKVIGGISTGMSDGNSPENSLDSTGVCDTINTRHSDDRFPEDDTIIRTADNGKKYAINTSTGQTSGLGPDVDKSTSSESQPPIKHQKPTKFTRQGTELTVDKNTRIKIGNNGKTVMLAGKLTDIEDFAGTPDTKPLEKEPEIISVYGGKAGEWIHSKGIGSIRRSDGTVQKAEIHWIEHPTIGQIAWKVKKFVKE